MTVQTAIAFATLLLEDNHVFTFHEGSLYLANNLCTFDGRCANLNGTVGIYEQNAVELYRVTFLALVAEIVDIQLLALLGTELLSLNFYNCVHLLFCSLNVCP